MCVFHQNRSHLPPFYPTALDHRTSRSTPLISLSPLPLFFSLCFEFLTLYFIFTALESIMLFLGLSQPISPLLAPPVFCLLTILTSPVLHSPLLTLADLLAPCLLLLSPPFSCSLWLFLSLSEGWLSKLWSSQNPSVMRWTLLTQLEKSLFRISFVHFWHWPTDDNLQHIASLSTETSLC